MHDTLLESLRSQAPAIRARWEVLLHAEPVATPLGCPDALVHLLDWTMGAIFHELAAPLRRRSHHRRAHAGDGSAECPCGRNPLLTYFVAGEQALREALILAQAAVPHLDPCDRDASLEELNLAFRHIARREIEAFCGVCQHRQEAEMCHVATTPTPAPFHPAVSAK